MKLIGAILLPLVILAVSTLIYAQSPAWWRTPDSSVRMAAQSPAIAGEKTRSAQQQAVEKPPFHSIPEPSGITAEQVTFFLVLIGLVAGSILRFIVQPENRKRDLAAKEALDERLTKFRAAIDAEFERKPARPADNISRTENDLMEENAQLEHQILAERITSLRATVENQGTRLDQEFGKVWRVCQRILNRLDRLEGKPKEENEED